MRNSQGDRWTEADVPVQRGRTAVITGENPGRLEAQTGVRAGDDGRTPLLSWYVRLGPPVALAVPHHVAPSSPRGSGLCK